METITLFNHYPISAFELGTQAPVESGIINTLNAYSFVVAEKNEVFKQALSHSDLLLPDGFPIVLATRLLIGRKIKKIAGEDIHNHLLYKANAEKLKVMYLGSSEKTLHLIQQRILLEYPQITVITHSPPFKAQFTDAENTAMIAFVNLHQPDILFVGMTAPKQEIWVNTHKSVLNVNTICCIGAVFDFYAGTVNRAPNWMIKIKLEWFYRLVKEPRRMWRRYLVYSPMFFWYLLVELFKKKN